jgi:hypothetical protein
MFILKSNATEKNAYFVLADINWTVHWQCPNKKRKRNPSCNCDPE